MQPPPLRRLRICRYMCLHVYILIHEQVTDVLLLCAGCDTAPLPMPVVMPGSAGFLAPGPGVDTGTALQLAAAVHLLYLWAVDARLLGEIHTSLWRQLDVLVMVAAAVCQLLYVAAMRLALPAPVPQVLNALASARCLRLGLHHRPARQYLGVFFSKVCPMLVDFVALLTIVIFFLAVVGTELVGAHAGARGDDANFNTVGNGMMCMLLIFVEEWSDVLYVSDQRQAGAVVLGHSLYFIFCYIVLGIGLSNLLTSIVVEFMEVLQKEAAQAHRAELLGRFRAAVRVVITLNRLKRLSLASAKLSATAAATEAAGSHSDASPERISASHSTTPRPVEHMRAEGAKAGADCNALWRRREVVVFPSSGTWREKCCKKLWLDK